MLTKLEGEDVSCISHLVAAFRFCKIDNTSMWTPIFFGNCNHSGALVVRH